MTRALVIAMLAARVAAAQPSPPSDVALTTYLEKRVPEELAVEGVVLSRDNLTLKVEQLGDKLLVSLVDLATARVAASTKIDQIPADREAAVASTTHVAADLVAQVHGAPPVAPPSIPPPPFDERAHERFQRQAIRFGATYDIDLNKYGASVHRRWLTFQGDLDQELEPEDFYRLVNRPDLGEEYHHRHTIMMGSAVVAGASFLTSVVFIVRMATVSQQDCNINDPNFAMCVNNNVRAQEQARDTNVPPIFIFAGIGLVTGVVATYFRFNPHPISEGEAKSLADDYNQGLRKNLGLPTARREHHLHLAPFVTGRDGGLVLGGTF
jgi:hypothetical protein